MGSQGQNQGKPMQSSRLYVGGLNPSVQSKDLEDIFAKYGKILEIRMNRNFAFVQFADESAAQQAITEENGKSCFGKKLDVQFAKAPRSDNKAGQSGPPTSAPSSDPDSSGRDNRSPQRDNRDRFEPRDSNYGRGGGRGGRGGGMGGMGRGASPWAADNEPPRDLMSINLGRGGRGGGGLGGGRGGGGPPFRPGGGMMGGAMDRGPMRDGGGDRGDSYGGGGYSSDREAIPGFRAMDFVRGGPSAGDVLGPSPFRGAGGMPSGISDSPYRSSIPPLSSACSDNYISGGYVDHRPPTQQPMPLSTDTADRVNDVEIIVLNRAITDYGEFIERKLKALGFTVDVLFPNEEVPMGRVLGNIASRGTLYSVIVGPVHQTHRSLTLHILHGLPQEHRNMPVDDAVTLISRNFDNYMRQSKEKSGVTNAPPENIRHMLQQVLAGRELTGAQYDKVIQFFHQERQRVEPTATEPATTQEAELQNRILNILNKGGGVAGEVAPPQPAPPPVQAPGAPPILKDPSVQKALDSLIQGDLLRKITPHQQPPSQYSRY